MKSINFLIVLIVFTSCLPTPSEKFEEDGISFTCPKGWKIIKDEEFESHGDGGLVTIEKDGIFSSGSITLIWIKEGYDLDNWEISEEKNLIYKLISNNLNLQFGERKQNQYAGINSSSTSFTSNTMGIELEGIIHYLQIGDKSISISILEAPEDRLKNRNGFYFIEKSFSVE